MRRGKEIEVLKCILTDLRMKAQISVATKEGQNGLEMRRRKYGNTIDIVSSGTRLSNGLDLSLAYRNKTSVKGQIAVNWEAPGCKVAEIYKPSTHFKTPAGSG
jgi:hypothetical protein